MWVMQFYVKATLINHLKNTLVLSYLVGHDAIELPCGHLNSSIDENLNVLSSQCVFITQYWLIGVVHPLFADISLPDSPWNCILPLSQGSSSWSKATEFVDWSPHEFTKACRFWTCQSIRYPCQDIYSWGAKELDSCSHVSIVKSFGIASNLLHSLFYREILKIYLGIIPLF